ncbi:hypothetical protein [Martelella radicis]|uniref:Uncharacterized protein n=1 Tax=Martelella radicis TaxID=1397476 RepID=A0A7W6KN84_9HYPH|nr:hypothetical protein [Martelella radicis]MBB4124323.1 hypothetical protein [Martelella radicis]
MATQLQTSSTSTDQTGRLKAALEPAESYQSDLMLTKLIERGFVVPDSIDPDMAPELYAEVLCGKPIAAMRRVFENLRLGRYERYRSFLPKPAELSAMIDEAARHDREMLVLERERQKAMEERRRLTRQMSEEERERRRKKAAAVRAMLAKAAAARTVKEEVDER